MYYEQKTLLRGAATVFRHIQGVSIHKDVYSPVQLCHILCTTSLAVTGLF